MPQRHIKYKEFLATHNTGDIAFIRSMLDAYGIRYYIEGENFALVRPLVVPAKIHVDEVQFDEVRELLKDFQSGRFGFQPDSESKE